MIKEMDIVTILTILLFGLPVIIYGLRLKLFNKFLLNTLTNTFNKAAIIQIIIAVVLGVLSYTIDKTVYSNGHGNILTSVIINTALTHIVIGGFFYIPGLVLLNLINWIFKRIRKDKAYT